MVIHVRELMASDWHCIEELFGPRGASGGCWCMYWRVAKGGKTWEANKGETARRTFKSLVEAEAIHGVLAFDGDMVVGWASFGPREDFPRLSRARALQRQRDKRNIWAINCFFVARDSRRKGVANMMLAEVARLACQKGAEEIEGYPANLGRATVLPDVFVWTGLPSMFSNNRFSPVEALSSKREIYVLDCSLKPQSCE